MVSSQLPVVIGRILRFVATICFVLVIRTNIDYVFRPECLEKGRSLGVLDLDGHDDVRQISQFAPEATKGDGFAIPPTKRPVTSAPDRPVDGRLAYEEVEELCGPMEVESTDENVRGHADI
ncbi:MAG: hypothetical protein Q7J26_02590 [Brevundimonas sp.]|nr:hypothetical protein [Brevundimonas sp.]